MLCFSKTIGLGGGIIWGEALDGEGLGGDGLDGAGRWLPDEFISLFSLALAIDVMVAMCVIVSEGVWIPGYSWKLAKEIYVRL